MRNWNQFRHQVENMTFGDARSFLRHLAHDAHFLATYVLPYAAAVEGAREPQIVATFGGRETTTCLQVFAWPAGAATPIHDHTAWGAYQSVMGALKEERYARIDDGDLDRTAHIRRQWQRVWHPADGPSTVGAYENGIHRVTNIGRSTAISLHLYGPRQGIVDGRDYDPARHYVCDRIEADPVALMRLAL